MPTTRKKAKLANEEAFAALAEGITPRIPAGNVPTIWLNVFDKLDPQDKLAFSKASPEFHDWVGTKRTLWLFSVAVAPMLPTILSRTESLQCRQLCKLWTLEWDRQSQTHPSNLCLDFEMAASTGCNIPKYINRFHSSEQIQLFLQDMRTHPGNPFPGRNVWLHCNPVGEDRDRFCNEYFNSVGLLLERFGTSVHYSNIKLCWTHHSRISSLLRNFLLRLPHLRKLEISEHSIETSSMVYEFYRENPLPLLENLETLNIIFMSDAIANSVLNSCCVAPNIKRLCLHSVSEIHLGQFDAVYYFVNLKVLEAHLFIQDLERFSSMRELPPLTELDLKWKNTPSFERVLSLLRPFGDSLVSLRMRSILGPFENPLGCRSKFPHLKKLTILLGESR